MQQPVQTNLGIEPAIKAAKEAWPVPRVRAQLREAGICSEQQLTEIDEAAREEVEQAMAKAQAAKPTPREETLIDVYADPSVPPRRGHYPRREAKVTFPSTPFDAKGLLLSCIFDEDPCVQLESIKMLRGARGETPAGDYRIPLGVAKVRRAPLSGSPA